MKLSQNAICAVRACLQLGAETSGGSVSCRRIAGDGNMPQRYLLEVPHDPATQEIIVRSLRGGGRGGAFKLLRRPQETSLLDPAGTVEGPFLAGLSGGAGSMSSVPMIWNYRDEDKGGVHE